MNNRQAIPDTWLNLRAFTESRIALGRVGGSIPTSPLLELRLAHARARDAAYSELETTKLCDELGTRGFETLVMHSAAVDRGTYVRRPDLGRRLDDCSRRRLEEVGRAGPPVDLCLILADGLSASAIHRHAIPVLELVVPQLGAHGWSVAPIVVVEQGRVAIGDQIGIFLRAEIVALLIGERPGLSANDSLGIYLTYGPRESLSDADRNCISNIRPAGLPYESAARTLWHLMSAARQRKLSGVRLKDESGAALNFSRQLG